ncbi:MAG: EFR1 family ferrodoxin, partial [Candidatus Heimdallarchaeaceae archaeon]
LNLETVKANSDTIGFAFPHYASSLPENFSDFIKKLNVEDTKYIFAIATRGRTTTKAFKEIDKILKKKNRRLDSFFVFTMPSGSASLVKSYNEYITEERISKLESDMQSRLDSIQRIILEKESHRKENLKGEPTSPFFLLLLPILIPFMPLLVRFGKYTERNFSFYFDSKCSSCGLCEKVCLSTKIKMDSNKKPIWQEEIKCFGCFACLNFCPEESIQVKSRWYLKSYTPVNGRYHHPEIKVKDIAEQKSWSS